MKWAQVLTLLVFVVGVVSVATIAERSSNPASTHSSRDPGEMGTLAFYLLMERYTEVERTETTIERLEPGTLLLIYPVRPLAPEEKEYVLTWVKEGNRLVIFSESPDIVRDVGMDISPTQGRVSSIRPRDHWSTRDVGSLWVNYRESIKAEGATVILADNDNILAAELPYGLGEIVVITATSLVENIFINHSDNEIFLVRLSLSQKVYFDEYHLYRVNQSRGITLSKLKTAFTSRYSSFFIQLIIVITVFMVSYGKRFGNPRPRPSRGVQSSQLVISAAELYYRAQKEEILDLIEGQHPPIHRYKNVTTKP
ncbi:MAG: DUF4350 domain-containing protein [Theionarchaea archaeon]|nr:DUF4350 domain-containing protein [Theionarchaea archaeon]MBU7019485.1 DUF4350 domain-containing protein [Theionarchaea archaeon]MBU7041721.1 DUF4350 domain-containing protein [Theionarchaea archaeon]